MRKIHSRDKGKRGEREFCEWLDANFGIRVQRRLGQEREGGCDVHIASHGIAVEVKRREQLSRPAWFLQACQGAPDGWMPCVAYRKNRQAWQFILPKGGRQRVYDPKAYMVGDVDDFRLYLEQYGVVQDDSV